MANEDNNRQNDLPPPGDWTNPPVALTPEQQEAKWNRPEVESATETGLSLTDCLKQPMPAESATVEEIAKVCNVWDGAITRDAQQAALLAYRLGVVLNRIRPGKKYGEWERLFQKGSEHRRFTFSLTRAKRCMRLAKYYKSESEIKGKSLMSAYEDAGILTPPQSAADRAFYEVGDALVEKVGFIQKSLTSIFHRRESAYSDLTSDDLEDRDDMLSLLKAELLLNAALSKLRDSIQVNAKTLIFEKCPDLKEWAMEQTKHSLAILQPEVIDLLPADFLTAEEVEHFKAIARARAVDQYYDSQIPKENTPVLLGRALHERVQARQDEKDFPKAQW